MAGASTPAVHALNQAGVVHRVHAYPHDPRSDSYGSEAVAALADAVGVTATQILKTLVVELGPVARTSLSPCGPYRARCR